jgi:Hint domain
MVDAAVTSGFWQSADTWSEDRAPNPSENAGIDSGVAVAVSESESANKITIESGGFLTLSAATLTATSGFTIDGELSGAGTLVGNVKGTGLIDASGGELTIDGAINLKSSGQTAGLQIEADTTLALNGSVAKSVDVNFDGASATLDLTGTYDTAQNFKGVIVNFGPSDEIIIKSSGAHDKLSFSDGILTVEKQSGATIEKIDISGKYDTADFTLTHSGGSDTVTDTAACFVRGVHILTVRGNIAIETLRIGDRVVTRSGQTRPIVWIGRREVDCARHPKPEVVWPICVSRNAFGENLPSRDLLLSPGHNIFSEGVIIPVEMLVNEKTIAQRQVSTVEYWHIELDAHDIVFAEGLPSESYLDTGNRTAFDNGDRFVELHPDFTPQHWSDTCVPLKTAGEEVNRTKATLLNSAKAIGYVITNEPDLHILADARRIEPMVFGKNQFAFVLPSDARDTKLVSRTFVPAHTTSDNADHRNLGVCVKRLRIDGQDISLEDEGLSAEGWNELEQDEDFAKQRWTTGAVAIKRKGGLLVVDVSREGFYWDESIERSCRLAATA